MPFNRIAVNRLTETQFEPPTYELHYCGRSFIARERPDQQWELIVCGQIEIYDSLRDCKIRVPQIPERINLGESWPAEVLLAIRVADDPCGASAPELNCLQAAGLVTSIGLVDREKLNERLAAAML